MIPRSRPPQSVLTTILKALIPYSRENLMLSFSPNRFFNELEKTSSYRQSTLKNAYWRAHRQGLIEETEKTAKLTAKGLEEMRPFMAESLGKDARLMIIFDIPEIESAKRRRLRDLLKLWGFKQIQKSVWSTDSDFRDLLTETVTELKLGGYVEVYESNRLLPRRGP